MRAIIDLEQAIGGHVRIFLCGAERGVPQQFLDGPQVGAFIQEMSGEGMSERMRADLPRDQSPRVAGHQAPHASGRQAAATVVEEDRRVVRRKT